LRFASSMQITVSAGLTSSTTSSAGDSVVTITAGTGTVTFN
jgi:hypothetical protein